MENRTLTKYAPRFSPMVILLTLALVTGFSSTSMCREYITGSEIAAVSVGSASLIIAGMKLQHIPNDKRPMIRGHLPFEQEFQRWLGGKYTIQKKNNFLDTKIGAFATPLTSGIALSIINLRYPRDRRGKDFTQDLFLFTSGALATKGVTDIAKRFFARERPFQEIIGDSVDTEAMYGRSFIQHSFFSGHTSGAFFSAGFLNLRVRETMRRRMKPSEYRTWRWASSGLLYGWASFVGLSRVQAYKHNLSDIVAGAIVGALISEFFYNIGEKSRDPLANTSPTQVQITIRF